jgi:uncharacterized membrane protein
VGAGAGRLAGLVLTRSSGRFPGRTEAASPTGRAAPALALAVVLGTAGVLHLVLPEPFDGLIPDRLPGSARAWTYGSGGVELATAALVATPRTRRRGGLVAAALFAAVFPGNVKMALDWSDRGLVERLVAYGRLPLQVPLVLWGLSVGGVGLRRRRRRN